MIQTPQRLCRLLLYPGCLFGWLFTAQAQAVPAQVELYLPDAPPLTIISEEQRHGIIGDLTLSALAKAGVAVQLRALPWARAQKYVQEKDNALIIPLSRTPERESRYTWIAPVMSMGRAFFSLKWQVKDFEEARQRFRTVAVGLGSAQEEILRANGFSNEQIYAVKIGENPAQLLLMGRVDAWFNGIPETTYIWSKLSPRRLFRSPELSTLDLYLACSLQCDPELVGSLRQAVEQLRRDGTLEALKREYAPSSHAAP